MQGRVRIVARRVEVTSFQGQLRRLPREEHLREALRPRLTEICWESRYVGAVRGAQRAARGSPMPRREGDAGPPGAPHTP
jgi:hypothetical protein